MQDMALDFLDPGYMWISVGRVSAVTSNVEQRFLDSSNIQDNIIWYYTELYSAT